MRFKEKLEKMLEIIEDNLNMHYKETSRLAEKVGVELGISKRLASESFCFITNIRFAEYINLRKMEKIISEAKSNNGGNLEEIASTYGYSEYAAFSRAVKNTYNVTPFQIIQDKADADLMGPLSVKKIIEGDYPGMNIMTEAVHVIKNKDVETKSTDAFLFDLKREEDKELISNIADCQAIFGLGLDQIILAYTVSKEKGKQALEDACRLISENYPDISAEDFSEFETDCLYLVINYGLLQSEAKQIVLDIRNTVNIDIRQVNERYLHFAKELGDNVIQIRYESNVYSNMPTSRFIDVFTYEEYVAAEPLIIELVQKRGADFYNENITDKIINIIQWIAYTYDKLHKKVQWDDGCFEAIASAVIEVYIKNDNPNEASCKNKYCRDYIKFVVSEYYCRNLHRILKYCEYAKIKETLAELDVTVSEALSVIPTEEYDISVEQVEKAGKLFAERRTLIAENNLNDSDVIAAKFLANKYVDEESLYPLIADAKVYYSKEKEYSNEDDRLLDVYGLTESELSIAKAYQMKINDSLAGLFDKKENNELAEFLYMTSDKACGFVADAKTEKLMNTWGDEKNCVEVTEKEFLEYDEERKLFNEYYEPPQVLEFGRDWKRNTTCLVANNSIATVAVIIAANKNCDLASAIAIATSEIERRPIVGHEKLDKLFVHANILGAEMRKKRQYKFITYNECMKAVDIICREDKQDPFVIQKIFLSLYLSAYGVYETIESAMEAISTALNKIRFTDDLRLYSDTKCNRLPFACTDINDILIHRSHCDLDSCKITCTLYKDENRHMPVFVETEQLIIQYRKLFNGTPIEKLTADDVEKIWTSSFRNERELMASIYDNFPSIDHIEIIDKRDIY